MAQRAEEGGVGGVGARGRAGCGEGPCSQTSRRLSAPPSPRPLPPGSAASTSPLPLPASQFGGTALDDANFRGNTEVVKLLERYDPAYVAAQVGRAAPHAAPSYTPCARPLCLSAVPSDR